MPPATPTPFHRRDFLKATGAGLLATAVGLKGESAAPDTMPTRPHILMLAVDDLRPQLGCYGLPWMHTPHLDALATGGTVFRKNYCQYPVCGPSRASLMSGVRPTATRFTAWNARIDKDMPGVVTLPEHFLKHGYATACVGKVIHDLDDQAHAWSHGTWMPPGQLGPVRTAYALEGNRETHRQNGMGPPVENAPVLDSVYGDYMIAERAIDELRKLGKGDQPFFLSAGFLRPHLPFNAPQKYWELYDRAKLPLPTNPEPPQGAPAESLPDWGELRKYAGMPATGPVTEAQARELIHGYAASVSYMDAQVGQLLATLDELALREKTIVLLWADHGWHLGEHGLWSKHCLYERPLTTPLIFSGYGVKPAQIAHGLTENLDIYPTLCELAGLPIPPHTQGTSLAPALRTGAAAAPGKEAVYSRHGTGDSLKTAHFRYSEWRAADGALTARMLYDHEADPEENVNIAERPEHREVIAELSGKIAALRVG